MGVKDLWSILTPYCERKSICEIQGKVVAIDLAGWVCASLTVVDYFVHPRQHLKNLFFRTCYLLMEGVTPIFVLEGVAPKMKSATMAKRNEIQFRGVEPRKQSPVTESSKQSSAPKGSRSRFNQVLKQCENLLKAMGVECVQGPGEAEAYCAFLNQKGLVDGVISQDSDCFAYGAVVVYRNFSLSTQGNSNAQGGAVDVYDMNTITKSLDIGQNKIIVMALLCGCDYSPEGVGGVGRDAVVKLFKKYKEEEILSRIIAWRIDNEKYTALEMKVDDKNVCSNCGHNGKTASHTKKGCLTCGTNKGCDASLWKEQRSSIKSELDIRKKALADPKFPSADIIEEFLKVPSEISKVSKKWKAPNIVTFVRISGKLLEWSEIYCFQKFLPLLTRWQIKCGKDVILLEPDFIVKKRVLKGVPSLEVLWKDSNKCFQGLISDFELKEFLEEHPNGLQELYTTIEPLDLFQQTYPNLVESYLKSIEKPPKTKKPRKEKTTKKITKKKDKKDGLNDLSDLLIATTEIDTELKKKRSAPKKKGIIEKFLIRENQNTPAKESQKLFSNICSTPKSLDLPSDFEDDCDGFDMSDIVKGIINVNNNPNVLSGKALNYEEINYSRDDLDLLSISKSYKKRKILSLSNANTVSSPKRQSVDDSLIGMNSSNLITHLDKFKEKENLSFNKSRKSLKMDNNVSFFFDQSNIDEPDEFEKSLDYKKYSFAADNEEQCDVFVLCDD